MKLEIEKTYNPKSFEDKWYGYWLENNLFAPKAGKKKETFTMVIPPPNVTSVLHMGHGLFPVPTKFRNLAYVCNEPKYLE